MKVYEKPRIEFETFALNASIAAGCSNKVTFGPGIPNVIEKICEEYQRPSVQNTISLFAFEPGDPAFYEQNCTCNESSTGDGTFTS